MTWLLLFLGGCFGGPGSMFPSGHRLLPEVQDVSQPLPQALLVPRELDKQPLPPYIVEAGDVLLVQPANLDSSIRLPGDQTVLPDGTISLGRYGQYLAAGKTVEQVEAEVRQRVEEQVKDAGAIVARVVVRQSKVFYVLGEVNAPGAYPVTGRETALDAILSAGGLNDHASRRNIILSRPTQPDGCRVVLPVCFDAIVQLGDTSTNYQITPGDRIFVPTRRPWEDLCSSKKHRCHPCSTGQHVPCSPPLCSLQLPPIELPVAPQQRELVPPPRSAPGSDGKE